MVVILQTLHEYTACLDFLGKGIRTLLENSLWCIKCTFTMQWQQYLLPVSCFHFSVCLLHAWLFWEMTSLLCWKFTLVYRVQIHYAMATILVACVLQSLQNTTICTLPLQCPYVVLISKRSYLVNTPAVQCSVIDVNPIWLMHRHMSQICIDMNALF